MKYSDGLEIRGHHIDMYTPFFDVLGECCVKLKEIFYIPFTVFPRSHITCSRKRFCK